MEVTLNVDSKDVADNLNDIMDTLTPKQKRALAKQMLDKWLDEPCKVELMTKETQVLREMKAQNTEIYVRGGYKRCDGDEVNDDEIKGSSDFRDRIRNFKTSKEFMIEGIVREVVNYHKKEIANAIQSDPQLEKLSNAVFEYLKKNYGKIVQQAMVYWLNNHMNEITSDLSNVICKVPSIEEDVQAITQRMLTQS